MSNRSWVFLGLYLCLGVGAITRAQSPPVAPARPVVENYFGVKVTDPYRYMENLKDPEVQAWIKSQADHTAALLAKIPGRGALLERLRELDSDNVSTVQNVSRTPNGNIFYEKRGVGDDVFKVCLREALNAPEKVLVDPETYRKNTGKPHEVNYFVPSPNGRYVAYGISASGSEEAVLHVIETATGAAVDEPIDRAEFGEGVRWLEDESGFFYWRARKLGPNDSPTLKYQNSKTYWHKMGNDPERDEAVFGPGAKGVTLDPTEFPTVMVFPGCPYAFGIVLTGVTPEYSAVYMTPAAEIRGAQTPWKKIAGREDKIGKVIVHGEDIYALTFKDAPRFKVVRTGLTHPDFTGAETIVPPGEAVVRDVFAAKDGLYVQLMDGGIGRVLRVPFQPKVQAEEIRLPFAGAVSLTAAHPHLDGLFMVLASWTKAPRIYEYQPGRGTLKDTGLQPIGTSADADDHVSTEVKVKSHDGVMVPLSIVCKRGAKLDGRNPTLLLGYGAYGTSIDPRFSTPGRAWIEKGGVYAVAHVRGGGEYGEEWHMAGYKKTKPNTWKDFIACAQYLIDNHYTSARFLAVTGGSAGGILVGRALTERPDVFAAVVPQVGCLDMIRAETTPNGVPNIPEFGTVKDPEEFKALYEMSSLHHVKDHENYPAVLLAHGINDPRVEPWHSAKMAARLQAASASGKPVLLRIDYESGHGSGTTKQQTLELWSDILSFMLWQCGVKEFQPK